jgi:hypothetical protein
MRSTVLAMVVVLVPVWSISGQERPAPAHTVRFQVGAKSPYYADYYGDSRGQLRLGAIRESGKSPTAFSGKFMNQIDADKRAGTLAGNSGAQADAKLVQAMRMLDPASGLLIDDRIVRAAATNYLKNGDLSQWLDYLIHTPGNAEPDYGRYTRYFDNSFSFSVPAWYPAWPYYYWNFAPISWWCYP